MTREEKIAELINIRDNFNYTLAPREVFDDAIKALEQEPCEDAISRQAYIERYRKWAYSEYGRRTDNEELAIRVVMSLPPVTPKSKMGRWAILKDEYGDVVNAVCSCCDESGNHKWAFCPNCGAKMLGVEE